MSLEIIRGDITLMEVDAIVNAANHTLLGGGGVDGAIHRAAGPELLAECRTLNGCGTGEAKATKGYRLPCRYIIHTVGPVYRDGRHGEKDLLISCYRKSLELAVSLGCGSVAFPLISAGVYGYPPREAFRTACEVCRAFLEEHEIDITLVIFDKAALRASDELYGEIRRLVDDAYVLEHEDSASRRLQRRELAREEKARFIGALPDTPCGSSIRIEDGCAAGMTGSASLQDLLRHPDESFSQAVLRLIDERGMTDSQCYKRANVDRRVFSKLRSDIHYRPKKQTAAAFCFALKLNKEDAEDLLKKAGYALSRSNPFDIIIGYFLDRGEYDIDTINMELFNCDQVLLGQSA